MSVSFKCPACHATISGSESIAGRKVRCPECDEMVSVPADLKSSQADGTGTVYLNPSNVSDPRETVMLEAMDVIEPAAVPPLVASPVAAVQPIQVPPPPSPPADVEPDPEPMEPGGALEETEMDMTPMVDVTFLLLIFFMVTASFTLQKSLQIPKAESQDPSTEVRDEDPEEQTDFVTVLVDENNTFQVSTIDWEEEAASVQDLHIQLRLAREGDSTGSVPTKLRVEANGEALHETVVAALDAGAATGFSEVQLETVETE
jgi:biopolymer transport protein ExbD